MEIYRLAREDCDLLLLPEKEQEDCIVKYKQFEIYKGLEVEDTSNEAIEDDMYSIRVHPKGKLEFKLQFTPHCIKPYRFQLPLMLKNSVGPT